VFDDARFDRDGVIARVHVTVARHRRVARRVEAASSSAARGRGDEDATIGDRRSAFGDRRSAIGDRAIDRASIDRRFRSTRDRSRAIRRLVFIRTRPTVRRAHAPTPS
jgi:hypothetical protein